MAYSHEDKMDFLYKFAKNYERYTPESKDNMRAETCTTRPNPVKAAQAQLKRIEDVDKFYRRLKAFLQHGIKINSFEGSMWEELQSPELRKWLDEAIDVYAEDKPLSLKDKEITRLAEALTM